MFNADDDDTECSTHIDCKACDDIGCPECCPGLTATQARLLASAAECWDAARESEEQERVADFCGAAKAWGDR